MGFLVVQIEATLSVGDIWSEERGEGGDALELLGAGHEIVPETPFCGLETREP